MNVKSGVKSVGEVHQSTRHGNGMENQKVMMKFHTELCSFMRV